MPGSLDDRTRQPFTRLPSLYPRRQHPSKVQGLASEVRPCSSVHTPRGAWQSLFGQSAGAALTPVLCRQDRRPSSVVRLRRAGSSRKPGRTTTYFCSSRDFRRWGLDRVVVVTVDGACAVDVIRRDSIHASTSFKSQATHRVVM